jgi:hypothetical protein
LRLNGPLFFANALRFGELPACGLPARMTHPLQTEE